MADYELEGYQMLELIGEGTYGDVYKVKRIADNKICAIKFIRFRPSSLNNGVSLSTIREIRFLRCTEHKNIVRLYDIVSPDVNLSLQYTELKPICMIMEYVEHDMWGILQYARDQKLAIYSKDHVKWYMFQFLSALNYLHENRIMHRDLKTSNLLVTNKHEIKLTDFGLARKLKYGDENRYTTEVMTLWYRPPELLLGESRYKTETDIWSAGCIFGELLACGPIFPTNSDDKREELSSIFKACGTPDDEYIRSLLQNEHVDIKFYPPNLERYIRQRVEKYGVNNVDWLTDEVFDLLKQMLQIVPSKRKTAKELLQHPYFDSVRTTSPKFFEFSELIETHSFQVKNRGVQKAESISKVKPPTNTETAMFFGNPVKEKPLSLQMELNINLPPTYNPIQNGERDAPPANHFVQTNSSEIWPPPYPNPPQMMPNYYIPVDNQGKQHVVQREHPRMAYDYVNDRLHPPPELPPDHLYRRESLRERPMIRQDSGRNPSLRRRESERNPSPYRREAEWSHSPRQREPERSSSPYRREPERNSSPYRRESERNPSPYRREPEWNHSPHQREPEWNRSPRQRDAEWSRSPHQREPEWSRSPPRRRESERVRSPPHRRESGRLRSPPRQREADRHYTSRQEFDRAHSLRRIHSPPRRNRTPPRNRSPIRYPERRLSPPRRSSRNRSLSRNRAYRQRSRSRSSHRR